PDDRLSPRCMAPENSPVLKRALTNRFADPSQMPGLSTPIFEWLYSEGLRMDEAMHPLTLLTGLYGEVLPNQTARRCASSCRGSTASRARNRS
ncbi:MAG: Protein-methionine-sulfoxide reductase catalytic subunit MsrP, partial [uncultured Caballeronia sp.]